jgi:hypothetical protein
VSKTKRPTKLDNLGSLITFEEDGKTYCLGYLMHFNEKGTFDATYGKLEISKEHAEAHNAAYEKGEIEGLDAQCEIGQGATFYVNEDKRPLSVKTFLGTQLNEGKLRTKKPTRGKGVIITFDRKGRTFEGRFKREEGDAVFFARTK